MTQKNPRTITVMKDGETVTAENVETWWYNDLDLYIQFTTDQVETIPGGIVVENT